MTAWVEEEDSDPGPHKILKRKNLRSLFREDDYADRSTISELKESLISNDTLRADARVAQSPESGNNKPGVLVQVLQSWACSSQSSLSSVANLPEEQLEEEDAEKQQQQDYSEVEFSTLVAREGDCLSEISRLVRVPINILQRVNSIANIESLKPGQALLIPRNVASHTKRKRFWDSKSKEEKRVIANWGDTLWSLAEDYNVSADEIRRANNLPQDLNHLYLGQELIIPTPQQTNCISVSRGPPLRYLLRPENVANIPALRPLVHNKIVQALLPKWQPEPFGVPCQGGWLSSFYGWKDGRWYFHNGIDIALEQGTEVIASTSGRVTWSGWKGGYGKTVCLDHGNGFVTLYAHCDDLLVQPSQFVRKSQVIALSGNTGHSSGPHLHFEIHKEGKTVDPLLHLPPIYHH
ncbi:unnamed protein product [Sphagnum jensenii]|uniref:LysM domain-containing protein n=1 Tax=Sphagnum jensenii TaxID=128206 RepID=A0ABP1B784_9BRYO